MNGPILHVVQHLSPGGLEVLALELARAQARTHPAMVVSLDGDEATALARWPRLRTEAVPLLFLGKRPGLDPLLPLRLGRLFRRLRPSCVHTHHIGPLLYAGPAARLAGVRSRIHTEHDAWHLSSPDRARLQRLALALAAPTLVADAPHVAEAVAAALHCPPPRVILNGIDVERFRPGDQAAARQRLGLPLDVPVIGVSARLEPVKHVDLAIRALASVCPDNVMLAIAGTGSLCDELVALAHRLGLADRVRLLGHVDDMATFHQAVDVACLSSHAEGLPLSLLEAQACGVPVVATQVGGVAAAVCPATGRLVAPDDAAALTAGLSDALAAPAGDPRAFVRHHASLDRMADAYLSLIATTSRPALRNAMTIATTPASGG